MLHVHRAERGSDLVAGLAALLSEPPDDPFAAEVVAVPAKGIERWLAQRLSHTLGADRLEDGVCANVTFPRPGQLLDEAVAAVSPEHARAVEAWQPERAVWPLLDVLDACPPGEAWCAGLRRHLGLDGDEPRFRRYAVARRIAGLFASYAGARPEELRRWATAHDDDVPDDLAWQPELWRRLREVVGPSPAELLDSACSRLLAEPDAPSLPARMSIYGTSRISAARLRVLAALAERRDVHLWLHHPSPALWDAVAAVPPPVSRLAGQQALRPGHALLASLSRDVSELQWGLAAVAPAHADEHHGPAPRQPRTLLQRLQSDLRSGGVPAQPFAVPPADRSVQVHACHGRARQVEVLREVVLGLLADDPTLEPRDVLVLCPDVDAYAPLVAAVFGSEGRHPGRVLRVALADRSPRQANPLLAVAASLLELAAARLTATQVLDLAGAPPVRLRFGLDDDSLEQLRGWVAASGVRWGLDRAHREPWQMDRFAEGTWRHGLDRLLVGVAMAESDVLLGGVLPLDDVESSDVDLAGRVAELVERLDESLRRLRGPQPMAQWLDVLEESVLALGDVPVDGAWQVSQLRRELGDVRDAAAGSQAELSLADVHALLDERLAGRPTTTSFRTGGLTVCTLTPMRSVPHRVICLLGLDEGAFPRRGTADGDDLLARDARIGERDPRSEDRQLFLDALMAAGEHLVVTYSGADVRTGAELAPAVPLGEMLDALDLAATVADGTRLRDRVVVRHPLSPFDARNFLDAELGSPGPLSFDGAALAGALSAAGSRHEPSAFLTEALPPRDPDADVDLGRLVEFFQHPAKAFLRQRLDVATSSREEEPDDALVVELDHLQAWKVGDRLLQARLRGRDAARVAAAEKARGELPPSPLAESFLATVGESVEGLLEASAPYLTSEARTVDVELVLPSGRRLLGFVRGVRGRSALTVTYSKLQPKHRLRAWIELLALTASRPHADLRAVVVGRGPREMTQSAVLGPVDPADALRLLDELVAIRDAGLCSVLPLSMKAGERYAAQRSERAEPRDAREAARKVWESGFSYTGEGDDAAHRLVWGDSAPFDAVWEAGLDCEEPGRDHATEPTVLARLARRVWQPLLDAEQV